MNKRFSETFYRPIVFQEIERTVWPPSWLGHAPFALWLMESLKPETLVELGSHTGNSFAAFCQGARLLNYSPNCYAVDTWEGDPHAGLYEEEVFADVRQYFSKSYGDIAHLLRKTFNEALVDFKDGSVDLLNIDGYHTYEATKENFETWIPKMSPKGVMLIHDTNVKTADFGAWKFWDEIKDKYPSFNFLHSHGLGVVAVGTEILDPIKILTQKEDEQEGQIRNLFTILGAAPILKAEKERAEERIEEVEKKCQEFYSEIERERDNASAWMKFVQQHLGPTIEAAHKKLDDLGKANLEGIDYKLFVQRLLGNSISEAENKLVAEREEGLAWKTFVQGNLAESLEQARIKLEEIGKSNLEGIGFRMFVQRYLGQTVEDANRNLQELQSIVEWRDLVTSRLGETLADAGSKLDQLFDCSEAMQSLGHKTVSFVNRKVRSTRSRILR